MARATEYDIPPEQQYWVFRSLEAVERCPVKEETDRLLVASADQVLQVGERWAKRAREAQQPVPSSGHDGSEMGTVQVRCAQYLVYCACSEIDHLQLSLPTLLQS